MKSDVKSSGEVLINITSSLTIEGHTAGSVHRIVKSAMISITKYTALEYGDLNNGAYTFAVGNMSSEATSAYMTPPERKKAVKENSMKRWVDPREVAIIAANVASEDYYYGFATGANMIVIDGGAVIL